MLNTQNYKKGDKVALEIRGEGVKTGIFSHTAPNGKAYIHVDGKGYERNFEKIQKIGEASTALEVSGVSDEQNNKIKDFNINQKFDFLESLVRMTIKGKRVSLVITGEGGLGKSYVVNKQIQRAGLVEGFDYKVVKGFSTARGLYETLYNHSEDLIIFDDCDEALKNDISKNLLKGALDSYDVRKINWMKSNSSDSPIPDEFEFKGRIIFISNLSQGQIDQAILSRSSSIDLTMSIEDKIDRMRTIIASKSFMPAISQDIKEECLELIFEYKELCKNLTLRTLIEIIDYRSSGEDNWKDLAIFTFQS